MWKSSMMNIINQTFSKSMYHDRNETRSNLLFQMALYVNLWFFPAWLFIIITNLGAKVNITSLVSWLIIHYNSSTNVYKLIVIAVFLIFSMSEILKLYLGYVGNLAGKIPELASCWLILTLIQLPLQMFFLLDHGISLQSNETLINLFMTCLLLIEIVTDFSTGTTNPM